MNDPIPSFLSREGQAVIDEEPGLEHPGQPQHSAPAAATAHKCADEDMRTLVRHFDTERTAFIPSGMRIKGDIQTEGELGVVVFGNVDGDITTEHGVYVMAGGRVNGRITSTGEVVVAGTVVAPEGEAAIETLGRFTAAAGGRVNGDVKYKTLRVHDGGIVSGRMMPIES